jgi:hypothetical protein
MKYAHEWKMCRHLSDVYQAQGLGGQAVPKWPKRKRVRKKYIKRFFGDFKEGSGEETNKALMDYILHGTGALRVGPDGVKHVPVTY